MTYYAKRTHLIEGIGNEVLYSFAAFIGILVPMVYYVVSRQNRRIQIHPDSAELVETTRRQISLEQNRTPRTQRNSSGSIDCPVCLGDAAFAVETNCGHVFCGHCIVTYWKNGQRSALRPVTCPVCRGQVNILLYHFSLEERSLSTPERDAIVAEISHYNRRFSGEPVPLIDRIRDAPILIRHALNEVFSWEGMISVFRARVVFCFILALMYFISPLDIIPEALFGILGYIDDLFIILILAIYISMIYRHMVTQRARDNRGPTQNSGT